MIAYYIGFSWLTFLLIGYISFGYSDLYVGSFYQILGHGSRYERSGFIHLIAIAAFISGPFFFKKIGFLKSINRKRDIKINNKLDKSITFWNSILLLITIAATLEAYGLAGLFVRANYLGESSGYLVVSQLGCILGCVLVSYFLIKIKSSRLFSLANIFFGLIYIFIAFAKGSRFSAAGLILIFVVPLLFSKDRNYFSLVRILFFSFFALIMLHALLQFRSDNIYGLFIYIQKIPDILTNLLTSLDPFYDLAYNIGFSLPVTELTISKCRSSLNDIAIAFSPFPGKLSGWENLSYYKRISEDIPCNSLGELYSYSPFLLIAYMFVGGIIFSIAQHLLVKDRSNLADKFLFLLYAFGLSFTLLIPQYNLRSCTRLLYYTLALIVIFTIYSSLRRQFK